MNTSQHALISFSGNYTLLFIVFIVFIIAFILKYRAVKSKSALGEQLVNQDVWTRRTHLIRSVECIMIAVIIAGAIIFGFIEDPNLLSSSPAPIIYLGLIMMVFFIIGAVTNWIGYKAMK